MGRCDRNGLLQAKFQHRFTWYFHLLPAREHLYRPSRSCANARANGRAFSAARDATDDCSKSSASSDFLGSVLSAPLPLQSVVAAHHGIIVSINHDARQFQLQLGTPSKVACLLCLRKPAVDVCALSSNQSAVDVQVCFQTGVKNVADLILRRVHPIDHTNEERFARRYSYIV